MKKVIYILLIATSLLITACSNSSDKKKSNEKQIVTKKETVVTKNSDILLKDTEGNIITVTKTDKGYTFSNAKGKVVIISFFATWCPPCRAEIPHLNNLQERYKDKLSIVGILLEENKDNDEMKKFINDHAINYTISNSLGNQKLATAVGGVKNIPYMLMYGKDGHYITNYLGVVPEEMVDSDIESALKK